MFAESFSKNKQTKSEETSPNVCLDSLVIYRKNGKGLFPEDTDCENTWLSFAVPLTCRLLINERAKSPTAKKTLNCFQD